MVLTIYFVRHGHYRIPPHTPNNISLGEPHSLTIMGVESIVDLAKKLKKQKDKIWTIYTSPVKRTLETAQILSKILSKDIAVRDGLQEQHSAENTIEHYQNIYQQFEDVVYEALLRDDDVTNVIVSHELPISLFLSIKSGVSFEEIVADYSHLELLNMGDCIKAEFNGKDLLKYQRI